MFTRSDTGGISEINAKHRLHGKCAGGAKNTIYGCLTKKDVNAILEKITEYTFYNTEIKNGQDME